MMKLPPRPSAVVEEMLASAGVDPLQRNPRTQVPSPRYVALLQALLLRDRTHAG